MAGRLSCRTHRLPAVAVALLALAAASARAQVPQFADSLLRRQWIEAITERFAGTHSTALVLDYELNRERTGARVRSRIESITTFLGTPSTRDKLDASVDLEYRLPRSTRLFVLAEAGTTSDGRRDTPIPGINNTAFGFLGAGPRFSDSSGNRLGMAIGGAYNRQLNAEDAGLGVYGEMAGNADLAGYVVGIDGRVRWHNITPRTAANVSLAASVVREFEEGSVIRASAGYDVSNTDLYTKRADEDVLRYGGLTYDGVQARRESRLFVGSTLEYPMAPELTLDVGVSVSSQLVGQMELDEGLPPLPRDPEPYRIVRQDLSLTATAGLRWALRDFTASARMDYSTNEEQNIVDAVRSVSDIELARKRTTIALNDFIARQFLLAASAEYHISRRDTLQASGSISIYRYDTPGALNFFDKDEQTIQAQLCYARSFSPMLGFAIYGQAFLTHLVYLFGQNSNDNNWNRIFRLAPSVIYRIDRTVNVLEAEVLANYTEYDFEGRTQNIRGRSFRELRLRDSLVVPLGDLRLMAQGDLRISERGSFSWRQFAESPIERTRTEGLEAELATNAENAMVFAAGARLSRVKTFRARPRSIVMDPFADRTSFGPTARFEARLSAETEVRFIGWWEHRFEESRLVSRLPILFLTVGLKL